MVNLPYIYISIIYNYITWYNQFLRISQETVMLWYCNAHPLHRKLKYFFRKSKPLNHASSYPSDEHGWNIYSSIHIYFILCCVLNPTFDCEHPNTSSLCGWSLKGKQRPGVGSGWQVSGNAIHTVILYWLVVWTPLKNISQLGWLFPIYGKINKCSKPPTSIYTLFMHLARERERGNPMHRYVCMHVRTHVE